MDSDWVSPRRHHVCPPLDAPAVPDWVSLPFEKRVEEVAELLRRDQEELVPAGLDDDPFELAVNKAAIELADLLLSKHRDYGPRNISASPGGPLNGLRVRMWDKLARINNLVDTDAGPQHESLRDSFVDLANYALIGLLVLDGEWPA